MTRLTMVADEHDVELHDQRARADLARLALQTRAVEADIERAERMAGEWREAKELLRLRLAEVIERRRAELECEIAAARDEAAKVVADARAQAARFHPPHRDAPSAPPESPPPVEAAIHEPPAPADPAAPPLTAESIAQLVAAAVTASLSHLAATPQPLDRTRIVPQLPVRSRLFHLDVVLPLVLVVIVAVVTLAWVS